MLRLTFGNHNHNRRYCPACGHRSATYMGIVNESTASVGPVLINAAPSPIVQQPAAQNKAWLTMEEAGKMMGYSYSWLAHSWRKLGLHPTDFGPRRLFDPKEIEDCMQHNKFTYRGRPPKR